MSNLARTADQSYEIEVMYVTTQKGSFLRIAPDFADPNLILIDERFNEKCWQLDLDQHDLCKIPWHDPKVIPESPDAKWIPIWWVI